MKSIVCDKQTEYVDSKGITFMTKLSSVKYRVSNQIQVYRQNIVGIRYRTSTREQAVSIMGQTMQYIGACCMICLMPQSQVSCSLENPHFNMFTLDRPTCVCNRLRAFQVVQGFSTPTGRCSSVLMLRCTLASMGLESFSP